jgi:hypothetical protein
MKLKRTAKRGGEISYKNGKEYSGKYWNSKGEEVETAEEAQK